MKSVFAQVSCEYIAMACPSAMACLFVVVSGCTVYSNKDRETFNQSATIQSPTSLAAMPEGASSTEVSLSDGTVMTCMGQIQADQSDEATAFEAIASTPVCFFDSSAAVPSSGFSPELRAQAHAPSIR